MDILGIGNALVDIFWFSDDESALSLGLHPNHSAHISSERMDELMLAVPAPIFVAGGSASNSLKVASALGADTAFIGCTGTEDREADRNAKVFKDDLSSFGVECLTESRTEATGRCLVIHMPGGLKSVACAPSVSPRISVDQISGELVAQAKIVLVDGPLMRNDELFARIASLCREKNVPIALDGGSSELVRNHIDSILSLLKTNKTILFLNADESLALVRKLDERIPGDKPVMAPNRLTDTIFSSFAKTGCAYPCIVQKRGSLGAKAWTAGISAEDAGIAVETVLDDTGAGDVFNGAFLTAWLKELPLTEALAFANETARGALGVPGTRLDRDLLRELKAKLDASTGSAG
jgi:sugar/nucleoside kinase (ribokinase family)